MLYLGPCWRGGGLFSFHCFVFLFLMFRFVSKNDSLIAPYPMLIASSQTRACSPISITYWIASCPVTYKHDSQDYTMPISITRSGCYVIPTRMTHIANMCQMVCLLAKVKNATRQDWYICRLFLCVIFLKRLPPGKKIISGIFSTPLRSLMVDPLG